MPDLPPEAITAAAVAIASYGRVDKGAVTMTDAQFTLARAALEAAAPILAEAVARKILEHMGMHWPPGQPGSIASSPRRHFSIAARVAAGAFSTEEEMKRAAAEALARGDFVACRIPEDGDG